MFNNITDKDILKRAKRRETKLSENNYYLDSCYMQYDHSINIGYPSA